MKTFNNFLVILVALLSLIGCRDGDNRILGSSSSTKLVDIRISPEPLTVKGGEGLILHKNLTQPFVAVGIYSDGTVKNLTDSVNWSTDTETDEPLIEKGLFTPTQSGDVVIKAEFEGHISNQVTITVTDLEPEANSFKVTPNKATLAKGEPLQLNATLSYSDGTFANVGPWVTWDSNNSLLIYLDETGLVKGIDAGTATVNASYNYNQGQIEFQQSVTITVTNEHLTEVQLEPGKVTIARQQPSQLTAKAIIENEAGEISRVKDVTEFMAWSTNNPSIVKIADKGLIIGARQGRADVYAKLFDLNSSNKVIVDVTSVSLTELRVSPSSIEIPQGLSLDVDVTAIFSNGTAVNLSNITDLPLVAWTADSNNASITSSGRVFANQLGSMEAHAFYEGFKSNPLEVNVIESSLQSLDIIPRNVTMMAGETRELTVFAKYSNLDTQEVTNQVTWVTPLPEGVSIQNGKLLAEQELASASITAQFGGESATASIDVEQKVVPLTIQLTSNRKNNEVIVDTSSLQLTATIFDGNNQAIATPNNVTWAVKEGAQYISVDDTGRVTGVEVNSSANASVTATLNGVTSDPLSINVVDKELEKVSLSPATSTLRVNERQKLEATAIYEGGYQVELDSTYNMSFHSDNNNSVQFDLSTYELIGVQESKAFFDINVEFNNRESNSVSVNVTNPVLTRITVEAVDPNATAIAGLPFGLKALASFNGGNTTEVKEVYWDIVISTNDQAYVTHDGKLFADADDRVEVQAVFGGLVSENVYPVQFSNVTENELMGITVEPSNIQLAAYHNTQELTIKGTYSNGITRELPASPKIVFTPPTDSGLAFEPNNEDRYSISATNALTDANVNVTYTTEDGRTYDQEITVNVSDAPVEEIVISMAGGLVSDLPVNVSKQLNAFVTYKDNSAAVSMTESVVWRSSSNNISITRDGVIKGLSPTNSVEIWAELEGEKSDSIIVDITEAELQSLVFGIEGHYGNSENQNSISAYVGSAALTPVVRATYSDTSSLVVNNSDLEFMFEIPSQSAVTVADAGTDSANLRVDSSSASSVKVKVELDDIESDWLTINIQDAIVEQVKIKAGADDLSNDNFNELNTAITLPLGTETVIQAYGLYSGVNVDENDFSNWQKLDNSNVRFTVEAPASISYQNGVAELNAGRNDSQSTQSTLGLEATYTSPQSHGTVVHSDTVDVTLTDATLLRIDLTTQDGSDSIDSMALGNTKQLKVVGHYSDESTVDLTSSADISYTVSGNAVSVSNGGQGEGAKGLLTTIGVSTTEMTVQATVGNSSGTITIREVTDRVLAAVKWDIQQQLNTMPLKGGILLKAIEVYSDGYEAAVTDFSAYSVHSSHSSLIDSDGDVLYSNAISEDIVTVHLTHQNTMISAPPLQVSLLENIPGLDLDFYLDYVEANGPYDNVTTDLKYNINVGSQIDTNRSEFGATLKSLDISSASFRTEFIEGGGYDFIGNFEGLNYSLVNGSTTYSGSQFYDNESTFGGGIKDLSTLSSYALATKVLYVKAKIFFNDGYVLAKESLSLLPTYYSGEGYFSYDFFSGPLPVSYSITNNFCSYYNLNFVTEADEAEIYRINRTGNPYFLNYTLGDPEELYYSTYVPSGEHPIVEIKKVSDENHTFYADENYFLSKSGNIICRTKKGVNNPLSSSVIK
ncbi:Ig-like domain-containing protein [Vibrio mediterranei]|uniref:Ig-like domain-containing protein n=1 Tax=Vibrio mediterranei TaxID=689 RepID=UPI0038CEAD3F